MRATVVGAGGFLGRPITRSLVNAGYSVRGVYHSEPAGPPIAAEGGTPVRGDILDRSSMDRAVEGAHLVVHVASGPAGPDLGEMRRVRVEGAATLLAACRAARVGRVILGSGYWVYADSPTMTTEASPLAPISISQVNHDAEQAAIAAAGSEGPEVVVVRPGMVYGNGSWFGGMVRELRERSYRYVGDGANFMSPIDADDLGEAFRVVGESTASPGPFLAVDDAPASVREFSSSVAQWLGCGPPSPISYREAATEWGEDLARLNAASRRASNARLRGLGWRPRYPSYRDGVPRVLREMEEATGQNPDTRG